MQGASPLASPGLNSGGTGSTCQSGIRRGGLSASPVRCKTDRTAFLLAVPAAKERGDRGRGTSAFEMVLSPGAGRASAGGVHFLSPVCPAFTFFLPPSPRPALAERSSQREGGDSKFILPGATAPGTPALNRLRHLQSLPLLYPAGACRALFPAALAIPAPGERTISNAAVACDG